MLTSHLRHRYISQHNELLICSDGNRTYVSAKLPIPKQNWKGALQIDDTISKQSILFPILHTYLTFVFIYSRYKSIGT
jgi:hypothetical protein